MASADTLAAFRRGDNDEAGRLAQLDLRAADGAGDAQGRVDALCMLARVAFRRGDLEELRGRAEQALEVAHSAGDRRLERMPLHLTAVAARMTGSLDEGRDLYLRSIELNEALGEYVMTAAECRNLAYLELRAGNTERARELFAESVNRFHGLDAPAMMPYLTFDEATVAALDGDFATAAAKLGAAQAQWAEQGSVPDPDDGAEIAELRHAIARAGGRTPHVPLDGTE